MRRVDKEIKNIVVCIKRLDEYLGETNLHTNINLASGDYVATLKYNPCMIRFLEEHKSDLEQKLYRLASY